MPNWCVNDLSVTGSKDDVSAFYEKCFINGEFEMLEAFIPTPKKMLEIDASYELKTNPEELKVTNPALHKEIDDLIKAQGTADWYAWRINNWGTKWDVSGARLVDVIKHETNDNLETYIFGFDTAWGPPLIGIQAISKQCPSLLFYIDYAEPGMGFAGFQKVMNGIVLAEDEVQMKPLFDDFISDVLYEYTNAEAETRGK